MVCVCVCSERGQAPFKHDTGPGRLYFHDSCFSCERCKTALRGSFVNSEKGILCERCGEREGAAPARADPCAACHKPLSGNISRALGKGVCLCGWSFSFLLICFADYHAECFRCSKCSGRFPNGEFVDVGGKPTCERCA